MMETRKKKLGADHPDTLIIMNNCLHVEKAGSRCRSYAADEGLFFNVSNKARHR